MANVLIIDDRPTNREFLRVVLQYAGHSVFEAGDGLEALQSLESARPHLIISDILMPTMDGKEFVRRLREHPEFSSTPTLFTSAYYLESEARSLGEQCGVKAFIPKPCDPEQVLAMVDKVLREAGVPGNAAAAASANPGHQVAPPPAKTEELSTAQARLIALTEVSRELSQCTDIAELSRTYVTAIRRIVAVDMAVVHMDGTAAHPEVFACAGTCAFAAECKIHEGSGLQQSCLPNLERSDPVQAIRLLKTARPLSDEAGCNFACGPFCFDSFLAAPVASAAGSYGWIGVFHKTGLGRFRQEDEWLLAAVAAQLGVAYENATLAETNRRNTAALRQTERQLQAIVENSPDRIYLKAADGTLLLTNPAFRSAGATELPKSDQVVECEEELETPAGKRIFLSRNFPVYGDDGKPFATCGISTDITHRKSLEQQLAQSQKMEAIGLLSGGVAHDFNNLLAVIQGFSQFAKEELPPDHPATESIQEIQTAAQRATNLTRQLLVFSRKQILKPKPLDLNDLIVNLIRMLERLIGENIDLSFEPGSDLGEITADPGQIEQAIVNLVVNARDAMPLGGKLAIRTQNIFLDEAFMQEHSDVKQTGPSVMFSVTDTGCGMTREVRARAFEPFFTTKPKGQGTGLGLATVYGIVKQSGGYVWLYSEKDVGTSIKVYLPRSNTPATVQPMETIGELRGGTETVMVAEDEPVLRKMVSTMLRKQGYKVLEAKDGMDGLRQLHESGLQIHLLLTDVLMPNMGGRELADTVRRDHPSTRVVYMSGYAAESIAGQLRLEPNARIIQKPFTPADVTRAVRTVLDTEEAHC